MFKRGSAHLSDEQLADGGDSPHLASCAECRRRMEEFRTAAAAYVQYRDTVRGPVLPPAPDAWPSLRVLVAQYQANQPARRSYRWPILLFAVGAAVAGTLAYRLVEHPAPPAAKALVHTASPAPAPSPMLPPRIVAAPGKPEAEAPIGSADMLHVFVALDGIGADAGEPLEVSQDAARNLIEVRASGISAQRRQQIADALQPLPRVALVSGPASAPQMSNAAPPSERASTTIPASMARELDNRLGGAIARQEITDRVLEASSSALARAYAVQVLAEKFPPDAESQLAADDHALLSGLVERHLSELRRLTEVLRMELKPLLHASNHSPGDMEMRISNSWQTGAPALANAARENDLLLNRLLAGSYSQTEGDAMMSSLGRQIAMLEDAMKAEGRM
jgi:hypothetical protein